MTSKDAKPVGEEEPTHGAKHQAPVAAHTPGAQKGSLPPSPPPPSGPSWKVILLVLIVGGLMLWVGTQWGRRIETGAGRTLPSAAGGHDHAAEVTDAAAGYYTCSMHPWVILPNPGLCPVCHMDLVPLDPAKFTGKIEIDPLVVQNIGVRVAPVESGPVTETIRTVGTIEYNETAVRDVNIKLDGWIEDLHVNYLGEKVEAGQPLFDLYSPELYAAQQEYLLAYRSANGSAGGGTNGASDVLAATRTRLEYFDISPEQIQSLEQRGQVAKTMTIHSPHTGVVITKNAYEGMRVESGTQLYRIADLSTVWVMVTLYEYQLPYVQVGQQAVISLPYIPGQAFEGKVIYIYPTLDEKTRQVRVRLEFPNKQGVLKPGMFAQVQLKSTLAEDRVLVPREAVIDTGQRQVAFVSLGDGKFEPREVQMGVQTEAGMVQVLTGLKPGEMVVTSGQFLLDSESRVRESLAKMIKGDMAADQKAPAAPADAPTETADLPAAARQSLAQVIDSYLAIGGQLAADTTGGIDSHARQAAQATDQMMEVKIAGDEHFWHKHEEVATIRGEALHLIEAEDLAKARLAYADMSVALGKFLRAVGVPASYGKAIEQLHCPMYREGQGGTIWLQVSGTDVRNPYFGKSMLNCFDRREMIPVAIAASPGTQPASQPATRPLPQMTARQLRVDRLAKAYLEIQSRLAASQFDGVNDHLREIRRAAASLEERAQGDEDKAVALIIRAVGTKPENDYASIDEARTRLADLTAGVAALAKAVPPSANVAPSIYQAYCPMVKKAWLQTGIDIRNPYDPGMPGCGHLTSDNLVADGRKE